MTISLAIIGFGQRGGATYARYLEQHPEQAQLVAVAEPRQWHREKAAQRFSLDADGVFTDWRDLFERPKIADAVIIATQDREHVEPAVAAMERGYHVLLEKPMAVTEAGVREIAAVAERTQRILAVCHVLRYSRFFRKVKEIIDTKILGEMVDIYHREEVGFSHYAHSYVRGNWRNTATACPMILAKSCHDLDIILYLSGKRCRRLGSFGTRSHFRPENRPLNAADRCLDCELSPDGCAYSAERYYFGKLRAGVAGWPLEVITNEFTEDAVNEALRSGPYGRCVYNCDNDVVDHQVVSMELEGGVTANFTMTAFTEKTRRYLKVGFTEGELTGDSLRIEGHNFRTGERIDIDLSEEEAKGRTGHLGGDSGLMHDFIAAVSQNNPALLTSGPDVSLESHLMCFAAERARLDGSVEEICLDGLRS